MLASVRTSEQADGHLGAGRAAVSHGARPCTGESQGLKLWILYTHLHMLMNNPCMSIFLLHCTQKSFQIYRGFSFGCLLWWMRVQAPPARAVAGAHRPRLRQQGPLPRHLQYATSFLPILLHHLCTICILIHSVTQKASSAICTHFYFLDGAVWLQRVSACRAASSRSVRSIHGDGWRS